jgi:hypothetical protein
VDADLPRHVGWPGLRAYRTPSLTLAALLDGPARDGFDQAVLLAGDAPDLPGMLAAKLFRPLTTRTVSAAAQTGADGLLGLGVRLPGPNWLPDAGLDDLTPMALRRCAPRSVEVAPAPGWHRLRGPADLAYLDPGLEGWEATRALLTAPARP